MSYRKGRGLNPRGAAGTRSLPQPRRFLRLHTQRRQEAASHPYPVTSCTNILGSGCSTEMLRGHTNRQGRLFPDHDCSPESCLQASAGLREAKSSLWADWGRSARSRNQAETPNVLERACSLRTYGLRWTETQPGLEFGIFFCLQKMT